MPAQVYVDANATTPVLPEAYERMLEFLGSEFGNPSSTYELGRKARAEVERARGEVAALIGAEPEEIVFTGSGTESCFLAITGAALARKDLRTVITSAVEHSAVLEPVSFLQAELRFDSKIIGVTAQGEIDESALQRELAKDCAIASIMLANNETGIVFPIAQLARLAGDYLFHTDATQAVGRIPIDVDELGVDLLSFSGHKLGAPKGIGALYIRNKTPFRPVMRGGGQEGGRRGGTESVPLIAAFGEAARIARTRMDAHPVGEVRDSFEQKVSSVLERVVITGAGQPRLPNTSHLRIDGVIGSELVTRLAKRGVILSTGSACHSGKIEPSHVLQAMGLTTGDSLGAVRVSFLHDASMEEAEVAARTLCEEVEYLRESQEQVLSGLLK